VPRDDGYLRAEMFSRVHVVTLDRPAPDARFDSVLVNNRAGARAAVEHLIEHGHQRIGFLGLSAALFTMKARYAGYREAMVKAGLEPEPYLDCASQETALATVREMLERKQAPTALFAGNNLSTSYLLHALTALNVAIPGQVAVAGFDDFDTADMLKPSITVVRQPAYEIGEVAANLLFERIASGEAPKKGRRVVLPLQLVVRHSCGCQKNDLITVK
jgi:LacI family transcriptional regulator